MHLPKALDGFRVLFVTDIHFGRWFSESAARKLIGNLARLDPDLALIGGDFADNIEDERALVRLLPGLKARYGVYSVPGNNDCEAFGGDYAPFRAMLAQAGVRLLVNENAFVQVDGARLVISGLDESKYGHPERGTLLYGRAEDDCHILLTHSPWALDQVLPCPQMPDLALCGHTHGGQVALGKLTMYALGYERGTVGKRRFFFLNGIHEVDGTVVVVSSGIGYSLLPIRVGAPCEVHLFTLACR